MKVVAGWHASEDELAMIATHLPDACDFVGLPRESDTGAYEVSSRDLMNVTGDAEAIIGWVLTREAVENAEALRYVSWMHHGVDRLPLDVFRERGIALANVVGADTGSFTYAIAEQAWALLLGCAKRVVEKDRGTKEARWDPLWEPGYTIGELYEKTLVVVGLGTIGRQVATLGRAFGMKVLGVKKNPADHDDSADEVFGVDELRSTLARADYIVLALPLTGETFRIIDEEALDAIPAHAYLINVARGDLVEEGPLHRALTEGGIAGFGTDVWWDDHRTEQVGYYPVPSRTGINRLSNVLGSGDQAGNSWESRDRTVEIGARNIGALIRGEEPSHRVDLDKGY